MTGTFRNIVIFATGATIGSLVTWKFIRTKYERLAQEEIDSVKEVFSRKYHTESDDEGGAEPKNEYGDILVQTGYANPSNEKEEKGGNTMDEKPYVISPDDFGENDNYETVSLTYYADEVLTDDFDEPIEDVENTVGVESLNHFGDYEADADTVFVRNDRLKIDYEILSDTRKYSDVIEDRLRPMED